MKKVLLIGINAKYIHTNPAIYSLKAYVSAHAPQFEAEQEALSAAEYTINQKAATILADIYRRKPDVAAFSCYIWNWEMIQELLEELPKVLPHTDIWLGGPEVSFHSEQLLVQYPQLTGIMVGEGEETFLELFTQYQTGNMVWEGIKGLVLPQGNTQPRELTEMEKLPFLYQDLAAFDNRILYYESQRGCPFRCAYCLSSIDKQVRRKPFAMVTQELDRFLQHRPAQVKFIDRTFNCNAEYASKVWRYLIEQDNGVTNFHFEIAADLITQEQLDLMKRMRPGLIQLEIGVQSTNHKTLEAIARRTDLEKLHAVTAAIHELGTIHQHLDLIAGLPYEDYASFAHSFDEVYAMKPQQLQLGFLKVLKGSPMEAQAESFGIVYQTKPPYEVLYTNWLSFEDILRLKGIEEMVELYYNSAQFAHTLPVLEQEFGSAFAMYESLADFYEEKGYFINTPARAYRYEVLLDFAASRAPHKRELYRELLTFDMYLRENLKSRPAFAFPEMGETQQEKAWLHHFYQSEQQQPRYLPDYEDCSAVQLKRMTHIERFHYPVWQEQGSTPLASPAYVLFDYRHRDVLTHDARWIRAN